MRGYFYLLMASFLWGTTFVAQLVGMAGIGPFTYGMGRFTIGFFVVLFIWLLTQKQRNRAKAEGWYVSGWKYGLGAGCIMFVAAALQQIGLLFTTAGKSAFITCLYIVFVPLFARAIGKKIRKENWAGALVAVVGLYMLSIAGARAGLLFNYGDAITFGCSIFWALHILFIDRYAPRADVIEISAAQIGVCAILNGLACFLYEPFEWQYMLDAAIPILYAAVLSSGLGFTLQIMGQKTAEPAPAAIIMSLESVFGAFGGWLVLGERMHGVEIAGCILMLAGMLITQAGIILKKGRNPV